MFEHGREERLQVSRYLVSPATIHTTERAAYWGKTTAEAIKDCEDMITKLKQYQKQLFDRVQEIETAPYHHRVQLIREKRWRESRVVYHLIVEKVYDVPGIDPTEIRRTNYPGAERRQAIAAFELYKKTHPGIEAIKDIEKGAWEK